MAAPGSRYPKYSWAALLAIAVFAAAGIAFKILLPAEKIKALAIEKASAALRREVRLRGVSVGILSGLSLDGLEVSESPDFKAGTFLGVDAFVLKIRLLPLLHKTVVVDQVSIVGPTLTVSKDKKGRFNFDDLLASEAPKKGAPKKEEPKSAAPLAFELNVRSVTVTDGRLRYSDATSGMSVDIKGAQFAASDFSFDQAAGKLSATLDKLAADLSGLKVSLAGKVEVDPKKAELKGWHGRLGEGELKLSLTARDYLKSPDVEVDANLSSLDLDKLLAVKQAAMGSAGNAAPAKAPPASSASSVPPLKTKGQAVIGKMSYSGAKLDETRLNWELSGVTPDLRSVNGWAKLHVAGGTFEGSKKEGGRNGVVKALMLPLTLLGKLGSLLSPLKVFPDFSHLLFTEVVGDYAFSRGVMTIKDFHMDSAAAGVKTTGSIDLGAQRLNLVASVAPANTAPIDVGITGSFDDPSIKPRLTTLIKPGKNAVNEATQLLKNLNIFKK